MNIKVLAFTPLQNLLKRFKKIKDNFYNQVFKEFLDYFEKNYIGENFQCQFRP